MSIPGLQSFTGPKSWNRAQWNLENFPAPATNQFDARKSAAPTSKDRGPATEATDLLFKQVQCKLGASDIGSFRNQPAGEISSSGTMPSPRDTPPPRRAHPPNLKSTPTSRPKTLNDRPPKYRWSARLGTPRPPKPRTPQPQRPRSVPSPRVDPSPRLLPDPLLRVSGWLGPPHALARPLHCSNGRADDRLSHPPCRVADHGGGPPPSGSGPKGRFLWGRRRPLMPTRMEGMGAGRRRSRSRSSSHDAANPVGAAAFCAQPR
jgi:hypothetical protein